MRVIRSSFAEFFFIRTHLTLFFSLASLYTFTPTLCVSVLRSHPMCRKRREKKAKIFLHVARNESHSLPLPSSLEFLVQEIPTTAYKSIVHNDPHPIQITISAAIYLVSMEDDSIFPWCSLLHHICDWCSVLRAAKRALFLFDFFSCLMLSALDSIIYSPHCWYWYWCICCRRRHRRCYCYSNFKRRTRGSERCSSIFIDKAEYLYFFFLFGSFRSRTPSSSFLPLATEIHTHTQIHKKKKRRTKTNWMC